MDSRGGQEEEEGKERVETASREAGLSEGECGRGRDTPPRGVGGMEGRLQAVGGGTVAGRRAPDGGGRETECVSQEALHWRHMRR